MLRDDWGACRELENRGTPKCLLRTISCIYCIAYHTPVVPLSFSVTQTLRSAALEDCALCQETVSSSELAAKTRDGDFEGMCEAVV